MDVSLGVIKVGGLMDWSILRAFDVRNIQEGKRTPLGVGTRYGKGSLFACRKWISRHVRENPGFLS